jgi:hypothetical protein
MLSYCGQIAAQMAMKSSAFQSDEELLFSNVLDSRE